MHDDGADCTGVIVASSSATKVRRNKRKPDRSKREVPAGPELYLNRELSMLAFNERVLAMATRASVPLAERLRYICIVS